MPSPRCRCVKFQEEVISSWSPSWSLSLPSWRVSSPFPWPSAILQFQSKSARVNPRRIKPCIESAILSVKKKREKCERCREYGRKEFCSWQPGDAPGRADVHRWQSKPDRSDHRARVPTNFVCGVAGRGPRKLRLWGGGGSLACGAGGRTDLYPRMAPCASIETGDTSPD